MLLDCHTTLLSRYGYFGRLFVCLHGDSNSSALSCVSLSGMIFEREKTNWQGYVSSFVMNLAKMIVPVNLLLASGPSIVFMLRFTASSGTTANLNLVLPISYIISKWLFHISSHQVFCNPKIDPFQRTCGPNLIVAVIWVVLPGKSNTSATFGTHCLLVRLNRMVFLPSTGFLPLYFLAKFNTSMSRDAKSTLGIQFTRPTLTLESPAGKLLWGSF